ncbi:hypothetical protein SynBMKMC1_02376 [Synechococcus sp. BMK-MC-1]|nr:hypothetical protein SynBMKMC1_02376 [Synechococcus sp. BMK-MC-1]
MLLAQSPPDIIDLTSYYAVLMTSQSCLPFLSPKPGPVAMGHE